MILKSFNDFQNLNSYQNLINNNEYNDEKGENFSDLDEKKENIKDINDTIQSPYFKPLKNNFAVNKSSVIESETIIPNQVRASNQNEKQKEYNQNLGNKSRQNNFGNNNNTNVYSSPKKNNSYKNNVYNINSNDSLSTSPINKKNEIYTGGLFSNFAANKQKDENQDINVLFPKIKKIDEDFIKEL
ncbi:hypothetical protein PPERSA_02567 [Pseudocohnilembus persalinus]|uniref:Uncharacterized protein n=1 Tax=Pseudocohnilembus persalinus TaxID=266149 RepID=A0A0V0R5D3_PSEPJ|nr:hypothetical protein PPERSA_02567 [Pseudocohnilembus persalinus]|eukprot:KRX09695.1 hypothetical protein PPERSA_02567 [Pseudocohnilembus persalinus]